MTTRSRATSVVFNKPFALEGIGRTLPAGEYRVVTDEELIQALRFPVYRRTSTVIFVPGDLNTASIQMVTIDPRELEDALEWDGAMPPPARLASDSAPRQ